MSSSSRPVAQFDLEAGATLISKSLDNFLYPDDSDQIENVDDGKPNRYAVNIGDDDDDDEVEDQDLDNELDTDDEEEDEVEDDDIQKPSATKNSKKSEVSIDSEEDEDSEYSDYTDTAIYALSLKQSGLEFTDEISKDLKPEELVQKLLSVVESKVQSEKDTLKAQYQSVSEYIDFLLTDGGNPEVVKESVKYRTIANTPIDDDTDDDTLEKITLAMLLHKGIDKEDANEFVEGWKDKDKLRAKAKESTEYFDSLDKEVFEQAKINRQREIDAELDKQKKTRTNIEGILEKGAAKGLPIKDKKKVLSAIYDNTEVVSTLDDSGKKVTIKVPLYNKLYQEFNNDLEQQLAFVQLLLDGFDFTKLTTIAKAKVNNNILDALNNTNRKKSTSKVKHWLDD